MPANYTITANDNVVTITAGIVGAQTNTAASVTTTGDAALTPATTTDGVTARNLQDTFIIDFKQGDNPGSVSFEFADEITTTVAANAIAAFSNSNSELSNSISGVLMEVDDTFDIGNNALASGSKRIKYTYRTAGADTNTLANAASITTGDTNGTFAVGSVVRVTNGVDALTTGTLDTWSVTINGTEYTDTFSSESNADSQATQIAAFLNAQP